MEDMPDRVRYNLARARLYLTLSGMEGENAIIDNIFHELQDYESKMI